MAVLETDAYTRARAHHRSISADPKLSLTSYHLGAALRMLEEQAQIVKDMLRREQELNIALYRARHNIKEVAK